MNSRERVKLALNHQEPDRVPLDLGATPVSGMHVSTVYKLRQALKLDDPGTPVKVIEPFQMLGEIKPDLQEALGVDVIGLGGPTNMFGYLNQDWKEWRFFDGTPVLVPGKFNIKPEEDGSLLMFPQGDKSVPASAKMPDNGWYFDALSRQEELSAQTLNVEDNLEEFTPVSEDTLAYYEKEANRLYTETDKAIIANFGGTAFGDIALVPAMNLKNPKGIRDVEEWYISTVTRRDYVYQVFAKQSEIGLANLEKIYSVVGDKVAAVMVSGTDFGMQTGSFISPETYRQLYKPFHQQINNWIHENTDWKTFIHSCGSVINLLDDFIEAGFDILNPVQCSAAGMDPAILKEKYRDKLIFWGGGIDTQHTLPFGNPEEVKEEVKERVKIFAPGGGFVFNSIHNIQAATPIENLLAMYQSFQENREY